MNIIKIFKGIKRYFVIGFLSGIISSYILSFQPIYYSKIIELLLKDENNDNLLYYYLYYYILYRIIGNIFAGIRGYIFTINIQIISNKIKKNILLSYFTKDLLYYDKNKPNETADILINHSNRLADFYLLNSNVFVRNIAQFIIITNILYNKSFKMYIITFLLAFLQFIIDNYYHKNFYEKAIHNTNKIVETQNEIITDYIYKIETYRSLGLENIVNKKWSDKQIENINIKNKEAMYYGIKLLISQTISSFIIIIIILYGLYNTIPYKIIFIFMLYRDNMTSIINELIDIRKNIIDNKNLITKVNDLLNINNSEWIGFYIPTNNELFNPSITIKNLTFSYDDKKNIFNNLNLFIEYNKITGIRGESGIGKSTLLKILLGLYNINNDSVLFNNIKINYFDKNYFYKKLISYVGQEPILFSGTTEENILSDLDDYDINLYNKLKELIKDVPNDIKMSGGQRQRIAICRAFMRKPKILLLDEPTSSLDTENENKVLNILLELYNSYKMTIVIVSHKSTTLSICHNIIDLKAAES